MAIQTKPNYSSNINYLLECCNITYTQSTYKTGITIPQCKIGLSTLKKVRSGVEMSEATARKIASAFSMLLRHPEKRKIFIEDLYLSHDDFIQTFPPSSFIQGKEMSEHINMSLFTNKLYRCYYLVPNSPNSVYMAYFTLIEKNGEYHAYMVRGIRDFELVPELPYYFKTPTQLAQYINEKKGNKATESMHLYEAWNDFNSIPYHEDITFTNNRIKIDFRSTEEDPCYSTMFWNTCIANGLHLDSYIGGSCLIVDTNDGKRGKSISAFKMGLEAIEGIDHDQEKIIKEGPLIRNSLRVIKELCIDTNTGIMTVDNSDDNRWFRFIQSDNYRGYVDTLYENVNVEQLVDSFIKIKADYEKQIDELKNYIEDIKQDNSEKGTTNKHSSK